jgi:MFS family permease
VSKDAVAGSSITTPHGAFAVLRSHPLRMLWLGLIVLFLAVNGQNIARAWLARQLTGTNAGLGGVLFSFGLPSLLLAPWAGVIADRFPKRAVIVTSNLVMACSSLFIAMVVTFDVLQYWMLLVASAVQGMAFVIYGPCSVAFVAEIVERQQIASAISLFQMTAESMRVLGPAVVGVLLTTGATGEQLTFFGGAALFGSAALAVLRIPKGTARTVVTPSPIADLRAGISYLRSRRHLRLLMFASFLVVVVGFPYNAFLPTVAHNFDVGSAGYGTMAAVLSTGAVLSALLVSRRGTRNLWPRMVWAGVAFGAGVIALGLAPTFAVALVVMPVIGAGALIFNASNMALLLMLSDIDYHGRVQGLLMVGFSAQSVVALPLGVLADAIGLRPTLVMMGITIAAIVVVTQVRGSNDRTVVGLRDLG